MEREQIKTGLKKINNKGSNWSTLGQGLDGNGNVEALVVNGSSLLVGGE